MKKILLALLTLILTWETTFPQNVGIGTLTPTYKLSVQTPKALGNWGLMHSDSIVQVGDYISGSGVAEFGTRTSHPLWLIAGNHDSPFPAITIDAAGINVGLGTLAPANHLQLGSTPGFTGNDIAIGNGTQAMSFFQSPTASIWYSNNNFALMPAGSNGYLGIGYASPTNNLQIGGATPGFTGNHLAIGNGSQAMSFFQSVTVTNWYTNTAFALIGVNGGSGYVGINTPTPANKLQIGSIGSTGYAGNDIAFGNGTQVSAIAQTANTAQWYTNNTNIVLMPGGNGHGRVGVNTATPLAPLDVEDYVAMSGLENNQIAPEQGDGYAYLKPDNKILQNSWYARTDFCESCSAKVSIYAAGNVMAYEIDAISDARVKDIHEKSEGTEDLQTINKLQVTNYSMKDRIKYGDKPFKKVIAQQVEEVYPQVVNKSVNYIPNVYQRCNRIERTNAGYMLTFNEPHMLSIGAKKLQLIDGNGIQQRYDIVSIPSDKQVLLYTTTLAGDTVFVYGEQVNDFRSVDYEGLTTLNISATQELSKQLTAQEATIKIQNEKFLAMSAKMEALIEEVKTLKHK